MTLLFLLPSALSHSPTADSDCPGPSVSHTGQAGWSHKAVYDPYQAWLREMKQRENRILPWRNMHAPFLWEGCMVVASGFLFPVEKCRGVAGELLR